MYKNFTNNTKNCQWTIIIKRQLAKSTWNVMKISFPSMGIISLHEEMYFKDGLVNTW